MGNKLKLMKKQSLIMILMVSTGLLLAACGGPGEPESVEERAQARWDHFIERDFASAWEYYTPGYRQTNPREIFIVETNRRPFRWSAAEVLGAECEEDRCTVTTRISYRAIGAPDGQSRMTLTRTFEESWIRIDGAWWYVQT